MISLTLRLVILLRQGTDKQVESFLLLNTEEKEQLLKRRASKSRKRLRAEGVCKVTFKPKDFCARMGCTAVTKLVLQT